MFFFLVFRVASELYSRDLQKRLKILPCTRLKFVVFKYAFLTFPSSKAVLLQFTFLLIGELSLCSSRCLILVLLAVWLSHLSGRPIWIGKQSANSDPDLHTQCREGSTCAWIIPSDARTAVFPATGTTRRDSSGLPRRAV